MKFSYSLQTFTSPTSPPVGIGGGSLAFLALRWETLKKEAQHVVHIPTRKFTVLIVWLNKYGMACSVAACFVGIGKHTVLITH